jgi:hypothetical protein
MVPLYTPHLDSYRTFNIEAGLVGLRVYLSIASYPAWQLPEHPGKEPVRRGAPVPQVESTCIRSLLGRASDRIA